MANERILLVDDEPSILKLMSTILKPEGYLLDTASNGKEALEKLQIQKADLVFLDIHMPKMDGIEALKSLKLMQEAPAVIIMTGLADRELLEKAFLEGGVFDYILKPAGAEEILRAAREALFKRSVSIHREKTKRLLDESFQRLEAGYDARTRKLRESQITYRSLIDNFPEGLIVLQDETIKLANKKILEWRGGGELLEGKPFSVLMHQNDSIPLPEGKGTEGLDFEREGHFRFVRSDGGYFWAKASLQATSWLDHPAILAVVRDVSAQMEAQDLFRMVTEHSRVGIFIQQERRFIFVNPMFAEYVGMGMDELREKNPLDLVHPDDREMVRLNAIEMLKGRRRTSTAFRALTGSGEIHWILQSVVPIEFKGKRAVLGSLVDINEQKMAEDLLQSMHSELEQLVASISSIIICISHDDRITRINEAAEETLGFSRKELIGCRIKQCGIRWDKKRVMEGISRCRETHAVVRVDDIPFVRPNGKEGLLGLTLNPSTGGSTGSGPVIILGADITDRKAMEGQLMQALKLESIGQLAAGIAHEINTPIQYVGDNLHFLESAFSDLVKLVHAHEDLSEALRSGDSADLPDGILRSLEKVRDCEAEVDLPFLAQEVPPAIRQGLEGVERVAKIVASMKMLSHPGFMERSAFDIKEAIESAVTVCRNEWKYVAELTCEFDPELKAVHGFPGEFNQVILNLVVNAAHAIAPKVTGNEKGLIRITTRKDGDWAEIAIADTGGGVPENIRSKIFDPFFTTKEVGKGTGQGLAIAHSVITEKHGGRIWFESETGKGTVFRIRIPVNPPSKETVADAEANPLR